MARVYVLNGPNLNLLGLREPEIYGRDTLADVEARCRQIAEREGFELEFRQTNREYEMVDWIQEARQSAGVVINPAGLSYNSVPVLDALKMCECPVVEVHISNIHKRAETEARWRADSLMSAAATGVIAGLGVAGYELAVEYVARRLAAR
ncbi:type II 3-dehydroquinate dehydratase [Phenylobacterium sp.]|jgi:3-dehydroquinate dehydratase-2|uniref:type II 3-dehydroquinate dehydratase n=1 Tax=Phenylobacterium sp. TaxID=1871053 RepID=UPI002F930FE5